MRKLLVNPLTLLHQWAYSARIVIVVRMFFCGSRGLNLDPDGRKYFTYGAIISISKRERIALILSKCHKVGEEGTE